MNQTRYLCAVFRNLLIVFLCQKCCLSRCGYTIHRMLGPMLEANVLANMERMLGPVLVVRAADYTMRQIAQHWKQTLQFAFQHWKHPLKWDKKTDSRPITFQRQCWKLAVRHLLFAPWLHDVSNASSVQHWKYLTHRVAVALQSGTKDNQIWFLPWKIIRTYLFNHQGWL